MSGLAHYFERQGIPTVLISLIREHTARMQPPRALHVPFQLGRPFGAPRQPDFQRHVLASALALLERCDGPILRDFAETPPPEAAGEAGDQEGWACPVSFGSRSADPAAESDFRSSLQQEIALLRPWYAESLRLHNGRHLDGLTACEPEQIAGHLVDFLDDPGIPSFLDDEPIARAIKLCADDLKYFYYQAAMARPGRITGIALDNWFFGETLAGKLHIDLRRLLLDVADPDLRRVGEISLVPHTMLHHTAHS